MANEFLAFCAGGVLVGAVTAYGGYNAGSIYHEQKGAKLEQQRAAARGVGHYALDDKTGEVRFAYDDEASEGWRWGQYGRKVAVVYETGTVRFPHDATREAVEKAMRNLRAAAVSYGVFSSAEVARGPASSPP